MPTVDPDNRTHPELTRQVERDGSLPTLHPLDEHRPRTLWQAITGALCFVLLLPLLFLSAALWETFSGRLVLAILAVIGSLALAPLFARLL